VAALGAALFLSQVSRVHFESERRTVKPGLPDYCISAIHGAMKTTVTVTSRGVVTLPAKLRRTLGLKADDLLIAETTPEGLLLRPAVTLPVEIYSEKRVREFGDAEAELEKVLRRRKRRPR
jgi:AbrB family looped-hinge helix DNA binding protein